MRTWKVTAEIEVLLSRVMVEFGTPAYSKHTSDCQLLRLRESPTYIILLPCILFKKSWASNLQQDFPVYTRSIDVVKEF